MEDEWVNIIQDKGYIPSVLYPIIKAWRLLSWRNSILSISHAKPKHKEAHSFRDAHSGDVWEDAFETFKGKEVWLPASEVGPPNILKSFAEHNAKNCRIRPKRRLSWVTTKTSLLPVFGS